MRKHCAKETNYFIVIYFNLHATSNNYEELLSQHIF